MCFSHVRASVVWHEHHSNEKRRHKLLPFDEEKWPLHWGRKLLKYSNIAHYCTQILIAVRRCPILSTSRDIYNCTKIIVIESIQISVENIN